MVLDLWGFLATFLKVSWIACVSFFSFFLVYIPDKNCSNQELEQEEGEGERERRSPPPVPFSLDRFTYLSCIG